MNLRQRLLKVFALLVVVATVAISGFYIYADARGAREWAETKKRLEAQGENLDFKSYIPKKIPDDQNLAAIPLFKLEPNPHTPNGLFPATLHNALQNYYETTPFPQTGNFSKSELSIKDPFEKWAAKSYKKLFPKGPQNLDPLQETDAIFPVLKELREEAKKRPNYQYPTDYTSTPITKRAYPDIMESINLARIAKAQELLALNENRPDIALDEIKLLLEIAEGMRHEAMLIHKEVGDSLVSQQINILWDGLNRHGWTAQQLAELQANLKRFDCLSDYHRGLRGEAGYVALLLDALQDHRDEITEIILIKNELNDRDERFSLLYIPFPYLGSDFNFIDEFFEQLNGNLGRLQLHSIPNGAFHMAKARTMAFLFEGARELSDVSAHRVYPTKTDQLLDRIKALNTYSFINFMVRNSSRPPIDSINSFSRTQFYVDAAIIACALERYQLAHGTYPESLSDLEPYFDGPLPHDLFNGEPYHYKLQQDGTFLLYSVGWNQVDDGGKIVYQIGQASYGTIDFKQGDWVWPCAKFAPNPTFNNPATYPTSVGTYIVGDWKYTFSISFPKVQYSQTTWGRLYYKNKELEAPHNSVATTPVGKFVFLSGYNGTGFTDNGWLNTSVDTNGTNHPIFQPNGKIRGYSPPPVKEISLPDLLKQNEEPSPQILPAAVPAAKEPQKK